MYEDVTKTGNGERGTRNGEQGVWVSTYQNCLEEVWNQND